jgi:hypothetical protein
VSTLLDGQVGMKKETTFGTPVTVDRFYEVLADTSHNFDPMRITAAGLRVGSTVVRGARVVAGVGKGAVTLKAEIQSKAFGVLLESVCGAFTTTNVSGATYQQLGTPTRTTPFSNSYTIQVGVPEADASGTVTPHTYAGCIAQSFEIDAPERGIPTISVTYWAKSLATATALATASYATTPTTFTDSASAASTTFGGTITAPTTTAPESGGTASTNIRSWTFSGDLNINERPALGSWQQPTMGAPSYSLKFAQDYDATTTRALQISQGMTSFSGSFTGASLSTGNERFAVVIPAMVLDDNAFGQLSGGEGSIPEPTFTVVDNLTALPWYIVTRTADTAT